jgi:flagellar hook-basal body complex protein FliE
MRTDLSPTPSILNLEAPFKANAPAQSGVFQSVLENAVNKVEDLRKGADQSVAGFLAGEQEDTHSVIMATQKAELSFELFLQVRNKVVQAYQEVMRMQM